MGITTEIYTHVAIRKVKTSARENVSTGLKALTLIDRYWYLNLESRKPLKWIRS